VERLVPSRNRSEKGFPRQERVSLFSGKNGSESLSAGKREDLLDRLGGLMKKRPNPAKKGGGEKSVGLSNPVVEREKEGELRNSRQVLGKKERERCLPAEGGTGS